MADNITTPGTGAVLAFDEVVIGGSTVLVARTKLGFGADGTYTGDVSTTNRLPVDVGTSVAITAATLPLPTSAATSALQTTGNTSLASIDGKTPALSGGSVPVVDSALVALMTANNTKLDTLNTSINTSGPLPAGTNVIGATLATPDVASTGTLSLTSTASAVSVTVAGAGTVGIEIGTAGVALGGSAVASFEGQTTVGGAWQAVFAYPRGTGYRVKTTGVGGAWVIEAAGLVAVRVRTSVTGTGTTAVAINLGAQSRVQAVVPVAVGQTTRSYDWTNGQKLTTSASDQSAAAVQANEVLLHAKAACWVRVGAAASAGAGSMPLEAGEKFHLQVSPGDVVHYIQDTAAGTLVIVPVT